MKRKIADLAVKEDLPFLGDWEKSIYNSARSEIVYKDTRKVLVKETFLQQSHQC